jgi:hypothetical protein
MSHQGSNPKMISKEQSREIRVKIRHILMDKWDPIGVKDEPMAADEYDRYIGDIFELLKRSATDEEIIDHLVYLETERMGLYDIERKPLVPSEYRIRTIEALKSISFPS